MKTKDKQDEEQRHAQRDALIHSVFIELVHREGCSVIEAYIFLGKIWGLGERKLQQIVGKSNEYALSADDLMKLAVILQRISYFAERSNDEIRKPQLTNGWRQP